MKVSLHKAGAPTHVSASLTHVAVSLVPREGLREAQIPSTTHSFSLPLCSPQGVCLRWGFISVNSCTDRSNSCNGDRFIGAGLISFVMTGSMTVYSRHGAESSTSGSLGIMKRVFWGPGSSIWNPKAHPQATATPPKIYLLIAPVLWAYRGAIFFFKPPQRDNFSKVSLIFFFLQPDWPLLQFCDCIFSTLSSQR